MKETYGNSTNIGKREDALVSIFGPMKHVWHEKTEEDPHIDIYCFPPGHAGRDFFTLVTGGMSDRVMNVPPELPPDYPRRIELVFYCAEPRTEYAEFVKRLAHYPFDENTWFGIGHTMETASISLLGCSEISALLFIPSPILPDESLPDILRIDGDPVTLMWVVPITKAECALVRKAGCCGAILDMFSQQGRPYVFDPSRRPLL